MKSHQPERKKVVAMSDNTCHTEPEVPAAAEETAPATCEPTTPPPATTVPVCEAAEAPAEA